jgi:hypothetical protein
MKAQVCFDWLFSSNQPAASTQFGIFIDFSPSPAVLSIFGSRDFSHTPIFGGSQFV